MAKDYGARPTVGRDWYKAHGLGNDYLVFEEGEGWRVEPEAVALACHRHEGVGADGLVVVLRSAAEPFVLRMFNPDGSEFERSGNGLRVLHLMSGIRSLKICCEAKPVAQLFPQALGVED